MFSDKDETAPQSIAAVEDYPSIRIVRLRGKIDQQTVAELERFRKWVSKHHSFQHKHVLIDFKEVTHLDTAAVAEIIQEVSELKTEHLLLGAVHLNPAAHAMLQVLKVEKLINVYENESAALEDMTRKPPSKG